MAPGALPRGCVCVCGVCVVVCVGWGWGGWWWWWWWGGHQERRSPAAAAARPRSLASLLCRQPAEPSAADPRRLPRARPLPLRTPPPCPRARTPQDDPRWSIVDPICTFLFAILVLWTTRAILRDIADVLMERVPRGLDIKAINDDLTQVETLVGRVGARVCVVGRRGGVCVDVCGRVCRPL